MLRFLKFFFTESAKGGVVTTFMKARIPTLAHKGVVDSMKDFAAKNKMSSVVKLSGTNQPLSGEQKKAHAERLFQHPVELADKSTGSFVSHLQNLASRGHTEAHVFVGSDRAHEIQRIADHHNLNNNAGYIDKKGNKAFQFPGGIHVHQFGSDRLDLDHPNSPEEHKVSKIHPTKMNPDQIKRSTSATRLQNLASAGDYHGFKAYHPGVDEKHVKGLYNDIRKGLSSSK